MITLQLRPGTVNGHAPAFCYRMVRKDLVVDFPIPSLVEFAQVRLATPVRNERTDRWNSPGEAREIYQGPSWIGNRWRQVTSYVLPEGYRISVSGIGVFWISKDGKEIVCTREEAGAGIDLVIEAAIGPALILALALEGTWCLHASAVAFNGQRVAFLGESGRGKSTLAGWLDGQGWPRLGDDILPVTQADEHIEYLPHFPQPKLLTGEQPSKGLSERLSLDALYVIRRPRNNQGVAIKPLDRAEGVLSLVRHTVAARLFDEDLLAKHLEFCFQAGSQLTVRELIYPFNPNTLQEVQKALLDNLQIQISRSPAAMRQDRQVTLAVER